MYLVPVTVKPSPIDGFGVFTQRTIQQGEIVWKFDHTHDKILSVDLYKKLSPEDRTTLDRIAYLSSTSGVYIFPPENDPAIYTNHSQHNNLTAQIDKSISPEPFFVANRKIEKDEKLTNNYNEFDSKAESVKWLQK